MTTQVQIIDRGGLVKLFGATISVAPSHQAPPSSPAQGPATPPAYRTEYHDTMQDFHNDKKAKTNDDDSPRSQEHQSPPESNKEHSTSPASGRAEEAPEEDEDMDHEVACEETTNDNTENKVDKKEDDKASLAKKKPDKLLPCPRCDSMDTKFCYFNNYNVNQPRHFCRQCQRYWTAGGAVRPNMAVGAGRRKKSSRAGIGAGARCQQQEGGVVVVMDPAVADHAGNTASGDTDGAILSFGGGMVSSSSNCLTATNQRQASVAQASPMENFHVPVPQMPWAVNGVGTNTPMYFYGGNPTMPSANGFTTTPQPVHLCWTPTPAAPGGWQLFSVYPWGPQMPSYHPTAAPPPMVSAPTAVVGKQSRSHHSHSSYDVDGHSYGSSAVDDRQSSSSLDTSPLPKSTAAKKRSSAIREEEEVGACRSYQLVSDINRHRTEEVSKVLQSNPAAMMRSLNFQEGV